MVSEDFLLSQGKGKSWVQDDRVSGNWMAVVLCSHGSLAYSQKCLEEKSEILQEKISQLEDRAAQLQGSPALEKGEVLGDALQVGIDRNSKAIC